MYGKIHSPGLGNTPRFLESRPVLMWMLPYKNMPCEMSTVVQIVSAGYFDEKHKVTPNILDHSKCA